MNKDTTLIVGGTAAIAAIAGIAFLASKSKGSTTSNVSNLQLSGPTNVNVNTPTTYTVLATDNNGNPVSGVNITLTDLTTGQSSTAATDTTGTATFTVTFNNPGTYVLQASCC